MHFLFQMRCVPSLLLVGEDLDLSYKHINDKISEKAGESGILICVDTLSYKSLIHKNMIHYISYSLMEVGLSALKLRFHVAYCRLCVIVDKLLYVSVFSIYHKGVIEFTFFQFLLLLVLSVIGFITEVLGADLGPAATTGNGKFCDAFSVNLCAFRESLTNCLIMTRMLSCD